SRIAFCMRCRPSPIPMIPPRRDNGSRRPGMQTAGAREASLRRAIMRVKPEYFSWPLDGQERYRVTMPEADDFRIRQAVLKALFDIQVSTRERLHAVFDAFNDA